MRDWGPSTTLIALRGSKFTHFERCQAPGPRPALVKYKISSGSSSVPVVANTRCCCLSQPNLQELESYQRPEKKLIMQISSRCVGSDSVRHLHTLGQTVWRIAWPINTRARNEPSASFNNHRETLLGLPPGKRLLARSHLRHY